jgi:primase-polymerase (primpol)-like protein
MMREGVEARRIVAFNQVPLEIRESARAVLWKSESRDGEKTKVPYIPSRPSVRAAVNDPATWGTFAAALAALRDGKADGVGIVLGNGLVGVDLDDDCRNARTGAIAPDFLAIVRALDSYTEVSPSGSGLHVIARGFLPPGRRRKGGVEMYADRRYFTVTGAHLEGTPTTIRERTSELAALHARIFGMVPLASAPPAGRSGPPSRTMEDAALLERASTARNGVKFSALWRGDTSAYPSHSEADQALCNLLAFWTGGDAGRIDHLFRASGLMRPKWDERRGGQTYGERTITAALAGCRESYSARRVG